MRDDHPARRSVSQRLSVQFLFLQLVNLVSDHWLRPKLPSGDLELIGMDAVQFVDNPCRSVTCRWSRLVQHICAVGGFFVR